MDELSARAAESVTFELPGRIDLERLFLLDQHGRHHQIANAYLRSRFVRARPAATTLKYARTLRTWLNFLERIGSTWSEAGEEEIFAFKFWRTTDPRNPRPIAGNTWNVDIAALKSFYKWSDGHPHVAGGGERQRTDALTSGLGQSGTRSGRARSSDVKWLSPKAFARWRDIGVRGLDARGEEIEKWRPRNDERDLAFVEGLYGTGLRLQEWASCLTFELPPDPASEKEADPDRYYRLLLADGCAKGLFGHPFWIKQSVLNHAREYRDGPRRRAVRRARKTGKYGRLRDTIVIEGAVDAKRVKVTEDGSRSVRRLDQLSPSQRMRLFVRVDDSIEPALLWLNEDGSPRPKEAWYRTFNGANERLHKAGFSDLRCHPHMLRHSFALRWYAVGRLAWASRFAHLSTSEARDFRQQFGNAWSLVQLMLGHRSETTTLNVYLEPFRELDVEVLLIHGATESGVEHLFHALREHPRVLVDDDIRRDRP